MRQGCLIASYLYVIQAEPLAESVHHQKNIKGFQLPSPTEDNKKMEAEISMFADDTQLYHTTESSISEGFKIVQIYCQAFSAEINLKKTKVYT